MFSLQIERILGVRLQAGLRAWTQVLLGQAEDKAEVDMDTDAPQVSHKPGGEPKIKVSISQGSRFDSKLNKVLPLKTTREKVTLQWRNLTGATTLSWPKSASQGRCMLSPVVRWEGLFTPMVFPPVTMRKTSGEPRWRAISQDTRMPRSWERDRKSWENVTDWKGVRSCDN